MPDFKVIPVTRERVIEHVSALAVPEVLRTPAQKIAAMGLNQQLSYEHNGEAVVADLSKLDLSGLNLAGANLSRTIMRETNLSGANLSQAHLQEAQLEGAQLKGTHLAGAYMSMAVLKRASINRDTNLRGTNLYKATFSYGADVTAEQLKDAILIECTDISHTVDTSFTITLPLKNLTDIVRSQRQQLLERGVWSLVCSYICAEAPLPLLTEPEYRRYFEAAATIDRSIDGRIMPRSGDEVDLQKAVRHIQNKQWGLLLQRVKGPKRQYVEESSSAPSSAGCLWRRPEHNEQEMQEKKTFHGPAPEVSLLYDKRVLGIVAQFSGFKKPREPKTPRNVQEWVSSVERGVRGGR